MKNLFKSVFISVFNLFAVFVLINSMMAILKTGVSFLNLGVLIASLTVVSYFAGLYIKPRARTSPLLKKYTVLILIGLLVSCFPVKGIEAGHILKIVPISILLLGWLLYTKWYSTLDLKTDTILRLGEILPNFEVEDAYKNKVNSDEFKGHPTIFLFYRGNWCPLCMAQIKEVVAQYKALESKGVKTMLISPQPHKFTKKLAQRHNVSFHFLTDVKGKVAKQLGIYHENGIPAGFQLLGYDSNTILPTVIITDKDAKIIYLSQTHNYRIRPEPQEFLKVIDNI